MTEEIMDLVVLLARNNVGPQNGARNPEFNIIRAKRRLASLLAANLHQTRTLVWHAAQIISIANEYVVSAPCEILRIFMGYAFILAVAKYCPQTSTPSGQQVHVQLARPCQNDAQKVLVAEWIEHGGSAAIGDAVNFCTPDGIRIISREAQLLLHKMRVWGLSEQFTKILGHLEDEQFSAMAV
jgi:hypothetical protein